jgi:hypothetical protein
MAHRSKEFKSERNFHKMGRGDATRSLGTLSCEDTAVTHQVSADLCIPWKKSF